MAYTTSTEISVMNVVCLSSIESFNVQNIVSSWWDTQHIPLGYITVCNSIQHLGQSVLGGVIVLIQSRKVGSDKELWWLGLLAAHRISRWPRISSNITGWPDLVDAETGGTIAASCHGAALSREGRTGCSLVPRHRSVTLLQHVIVLCHVRIQIILHGIPLLEPLQPDQCSSWALHLRVSTLLVSQVLEMLDRRHPADLVCRVLLIRTHESASVLGIHTRIQIQLRVVFTPVLERA